MVADLEYYKKFTGRNDYDPEQEAQIELFLEIAEQYILDYTGGVWTNKEGSSVIADSRQAHIVRKYFSNQLGVVSESGEGFSQTFDERAYEGLRLTNEDKKILDGLRRKSLGGITTVSLHRNYGRAW